MNNSIKGAIDGTIAPSFIALIKNHQTSNQNNYKSESVSETRPKGKVIRLFRCFGCDRCFSAKKMSGFLIICRNCLISELIENERTRQRFVEKTLNKFGRFARRCLCQKF